MRRSVVLANSPTRAGWCVSRVVSSKVHWSSLQVQLGSFLQHVVSHEYRKEGCVREVECEVDVEGLLA